VHLANLAEAQSVPFPLRATDSRNRRVRANETRDCERSTSRQRERERSERWKTRLARIIRSECCACCDSRPSRSCLLWRTSRIGATRVESRSDREQSAAFGSDRVRFDIRPRAFLGRPFRLSTRGCSSSADNIHVGVPGGTRAPVDAISRVSRDSAMARLYCAERIHSGTRARGGRRDGGRGKGEVGGGEVEGAHEILEVREGGSKYPREKGRGGRRDGK